MRSISTMKCLMHFEQKKYNIKIFASHLRSGNRLKNAASVQSDSS